jgi:hypothetical protein
MMMILTEKQVSASHFETMQSKKPANLTAQQSVLVFGFDRLRTGSKE